MDLIRILVVLAILATLGATILGLMAMSGGYEADRELSTPLMWTRIGLQVLTLLLLLIAVLMR